MSARNAYSAARKAHSATGPLPCPSCGVEQPPEAVRRREDGTIRSECVACQRKRNSERMKQRRREAQALALEGKKVCTQCFKTQPLEAFDRRSDSAGYRKQCKRCRAKVRADNLRREAEGAQPRSNHGKFAPRTQGSALSEAGFAADLYAQALRALATSPPVPVWEREEWA